jgi:adenylyltransferase/sulfurtransferase
MNENAGCPLEISVEEACRLLTTRPDHTLLIDVREPHELAICHIPGARHIPMGQIPEKACELPADRQILVLCHHGGRSLRVTQFLRANNYRQVTNVAGGIDAWAASVAPGMPRY